MNSIGGAPLIDSSWDEESFNVNEFFEKDAHKAAFLFVNQYIDRCPHPLNASQEIACLYGSDPHPMYSDSLIDNLAYMFKQINIDEKLTRATAKEFNAFKQKQVN